MGTERALSSNGTVEGQEFWREAYDTHARGLHRYLARVTGDADLASDLVQEVFVHAIRSKRMPAADEARFWLYRIASNAAKDYLRRARRRYWLFMFPSTPTVVPDSSERLAEGDLVAQCLRDIPVDQAIALVLRLHEGFSTRETAFLLDIGEEAVRSRLARGRVNFAAAYRRQGRFER